MKLSDRLRAQYVQRWSTVHLTHRQSLAEHSFNVAMIAMDLSSRIFGEHPAGLLDQIVRYALVHDLDEVITGDIPTPTKQRLLRHDPAIRGILEESFGSASIPADPESLTMKIVKLSDLMESAFHVKQHGDGIHARQVAGEVESILLDTIARLTDQELKDAATAVWSALNHDQREW